MPWPLVLLIGPLVGIACGLVNGLGLTLLSLPHPFIMTLGTLNVARGLTNLITDGAPISGLAAGSALSSARRNSDFGIFDAAGRHSGRASSCVLVCAVGAVVLPQPHLDRPPHLRDRRQPAGGARHRHQCRPRAGARLCASAASSPASPALLLAGRTNSGFPNAGIGAELDAIAAVIIGGASFFGGRGTVLGVLAGVLIMGLLRNGLNLNNVSAFWQQILIGLIIILAVYIDVLRRRAAVRR